MKNIFRFLMAVAILFTASCAKEDISSSIGGGEVEMTFTVDLPELGTRAYADGAKATTLRYYVYDGDNYLSGISSESLPNQKVTLTNGKAVVTLPLLKGMTYNIIFWADNGSNIYTIDPVTKVLTVDYTDVMSNDDSRDAFYKYLTNVDPTNATKIKEQAKVTLSRPFGQLNAATSDFEAVENNGVTLTTSALVAIKANTTLNLATGIAGTQDEITFAEAAMPCTLTPNKETLKSGYEYLSMNYLLPGTVDAVYTFKGKRSDNSEVEFTGTTYTNVPVKANYRTNILGALLTAPTQFTVEIEEEFDEPAEEITVVEVSTVADLQEAINNASTEPGKSTEIIINDDIDLSDLFSLGTLSTRAEEAKLPIIIPAEKSIILDLNGCKINTPFEDENAGKHYYAFKNLGTLTIKDTKGEGAIYARGNFNYGTMTVESGTIYAIDGDGGYGVRNYEGATFTMNGGTIATTLEDDHQVNNGGYDATTLRVDEGATAVINGGTITNICDYTFAIDNHGDTTVNGGTFTSVHTNTSNYGTLTIDGGSFTCNGLDGITAHALWAAAGTTTINGGTFDGKDNYNGFNVDASEGATVYIFGGVFEPVHSGSLYGEGSIVVSGGKFFDKNDEIEDRLADGCTLVQEEGGYWVVNISPAAQIGDTPYSTLEEAVDAVQNSETIQLLRNVILTETLVIPAADKNISLDLNGKTVTGTMDNSVGHVIKNEGTLTIKNGTISSTAANGGSAVYNYGTLTVENTTINGAQNGASGYASYALNTAGNGSSVELNNVNISGRGAIGATNGTKVTVNSGSYHTPMAHWGHAVYAYGAGTEIVINGGTFTEGYNYAANLWGMYQIYAGNGAKVIVNNGDFSQNWDCANGYDLCTATDGAIVIYGGTFADNPSSQNGKNFVAAGYKAVKNGETWTVYKNIEASNASDLAAALAQGGVVTLGADIALTETAVIAEGKSVVLDLNGKTITGTMDKSVGHVIKNEGTLTIMNGTISSTAANGGSAVANYGTLTVENTTLNGASIRENEGWPSYPVNNYGDITLKETTINGYHGAIACTSKGTTTLENCTINKEYLNTSSHTFYITHAEANVVVNGGTYTHKGMDGSLAYVTAGSITVNGGNFNAENGGYGMAALTNGKIVINGGNFNKPCLNWGGIIEINGSNLK